MRKLVVLALVLLGVGFTIDAQILGGNSAPDQAVARIFAVNLWSAAVDIQLGDPSVFSVEGLKPGAPSTIGLISPAVGAKLYYKPSQDASWRQYRGGDGSPFEFTFKPGANYLIRVASDGDVQLIAMADVSTGKAHVLMVNASGQSLDELALLPGTMQASLRALKLPDQAFTEFSDIPAGNYASRWTSQGQSAFALGDKNSIALVTLRGDAWYCLLVQTAANQTNAGFNGHIWDISPATVSFAP